ncbi:MAG: hypothetical protein LBD13_05410 [Spirochaetaceae bacterium]|nr:hypothetical protein [Spirochaetaceae bacterium]
MSGGAAGKPGKGYSRKHDVKERFAADTFAALRQTDGLQNAAATAAAMQGGQTALLTPMVTNLYQGLSPAIIRTFNILAKKKMLPPMPPALRQRGGSVKLDFFGTLAQAQKAAYEFGGMDALAIAGQFARFGQTMPEFAPCGSRRLFHVLLAAGGFARLVTTQKQRLSGRRRRKGAKHEALVGGLGELVPPNPR